MQLDRDNPWPGLASFEEDAQAYFFGRNREIGALGNHVLDSPVTVLYGRSGLGKTSLLQAGLFPVLRARHLLPIYVRFDLKPDAARLVDQLRHAVCDSIRAQAPDAVLPSEGELLWEYLHRKDFELWSAQNYPLTPVIVLDQFEELFTLGERVPDLVREFRDDLGDLAENRIPADLAARIENDEGVAARFDLRSRTSKLLISLREDFLPELEGWRQLIPSLGRSRVRLLNLRASDALAAVHEPAAHLMTEPLARRVVAIVAGEDLHRGHDTAHSESDHPHDHRGESDVEPALLSLFCRELNEERKRRGQPQFDKQLVEDAKRDILSNYYSSCVNGMPPRVARFIESELITEKGFRNSYPREDAVPSHLTDDELTRLIQSRLLRIEERYGAQRIELTHDVLTRVVREHRDRRRVQEESAAREARHAAAQQRQQAALRDAHERQREAENYARALRKRSRTLRAVLAGTVIIAVLAVVAALLTWRAYDEANTRKQEALGERLASEGQAILSGGQPGSELPAFVKVIAAQNLSPQANVGGLRLAVDGWSNLDEIYPNSGMFSRILSGDGQRVANTDDDGVHLIDTRTWMPVGAPVDNPAAYATAIDFSGRYLTIFDSTDKTTGVWDTDTGDYIGQRVPGGTTVGEAAVSMDGRRVAVSDDQGLRLWDPKTGQPVATLTTDPGISVTALAFSPDGRRLATATSDREGTIQLWDAETGAALRETSQFRDEAIRDYDFVSSLAFSPDGTVVAAGGFTVGVSSLNGGTPLRIWNADTGELIGAPAAGDYGLIWSLAFSPDGHHIVTGSTDKSVRLWDGATGQPTGNQLRFQSPVEHVAFTKAEDSLIAVTDESVQKLDGQLDEQLLVETAGSKAAPLDLADTLGVDTTTDVPQIVFTRDNSRHRLNADTGEHISTFTNDTLRSVRTQSGKAADWSRDYRWLAIAGEDNAIRILDTSNGRPAGQPVTGYNGADKGFTISPDGKVLAYTSDDNAVRLWDTQRGKQIGDPLSGDEAATYEVTFSQDGTHLFARGDSSIWVWDMTMRPPLGEQVAGRDSPTYFDDMAVSPDGHRVATATLRGEIQVWDVDSGESIGKPMTGHSGISGIVYSPNGDFLASIGDVGTDDTLRFWDAESGEQVGQPVDTESIGAAGSVEFGKDGQTAYIVGLPVTLTGSGPTAGSPAVWQLPAPAAWKDVLCEKLVANPSEEQWREWVSPDVEYKEPCPGKPRAADTSSE
ncbi:conserved hypothetical protein [Rhodococcus sp. RD6.2]|uniref:nSTAND1 domain-containing NTPase n=1 Tax=Rhodococcus sp. RD6.2 TaxID=260936 RepID=UPI00063B6D6E|nr:PD40 domain-containing protein [Rhodococcus sp. RD6.2]CRK52945.1 conserved hypothetical protein [Rhodococcus sp. RD6.2]